MKLTLIIYLFLYTINLFYQSLVKIKWKGAGNMMKAMGDAFI